MGSSGVPPDVLDNVVDLLSACPAFVGVPRESLIRLAAGARIGHMAAVEQPATPAFVVQRGGLLVRDADDRTVDMVAQGEFCAPEPDQRLDPVEPSLVVWLPERASTWPGRPPMERLHESVVRTRAVTDRLADGRRSHGHEQPVHTAEPDEACAAVARRMTREHISSIVVFAGDQLGMATDRDLRTRLVADGRSADTPIGQIATFAVCTVSARTPVFEAVIVMLTAGIHHLPVVEDGRLVGMVSSNDVLDLGTRNPLHLRAALDPAEDVAAVSAALNYLPPALEALLAAGTTAGDVGRVVATVTDGVQQRLLALAFSELGAPPSDYGWIAFGGQARREQTLQSDQDHGLLLPDGLDAAAHGWWRALAEWMVEALERCGYPALQGRCHGIQ